ncbi:spore coat protein SP96-like [Phycodurus eques]|uniref:spore coat protein SP96-like n=1 Tax=Phycodurus eques TaxID=693459 RepID=UPI002ACDD2CA|nr:spore coat protein SP96-like [Phycodurus eques]
MEKSATFVLSLWLIFMAASSTLGQSATTSETSLTENPQQASSSQSTATTPTPTPGRSSTHDHKVDTSTAASHLPSSTSGRSAITTASRQPAVSSGATSSPGVTPSTPASSSSGTDSARLSATTLKAGTTSLFKLSSPMLVSVISILICNA